MRLVLFLTLLLRAASAHPCTVSVQVRADCSQKGLSNIPFTLPRHLQYLDLSTNSIHHLQPFPGKFSELLYLNLSGNPLHSLPAGAFKTLSHLRALDLSRCEVSRLHSDAFQGLLHLQTLILGDNPLRDIDLRNLRALTRLDVRGTGLVASPRMGDLMDELAGRIFCDCSSRRPIHESSDQVSGEFCSCVAPAARRDRDVRTAEEAADEAAEEAASEVVKRYARDISAPSNNSLVSNLTTPSAATTTAASQGRSWPYLVGFVLIAATLSLLIAAAAKCNLFHRYFRSYRHRPLPDNEWITESQNELPGVPLPHDDEDGFIEDNYIQPSDHREDLDDEEEDETRIPHGEL